MDIFATIFNNGVKWMTFQQIKSWPRIGEDIWIGAEDDPHIITHIERKRNNQFDYDHLKIWAMDKETNDMVNDDLSVVNEGKR